MAGRPGPDSDTVTGTDCIAGTIIGKPGVMACFWGSHMGLVDLMLERIGTSWRIVSHTSEARPIFQRKEDRSISPRVEDVPEVLAAAQGEHDATLEYVRGAVGKTEPPLHSYFALIADDPSFQIVSIAQGWYIAQILAGTEYADFPLLSAAAPFKAGGRGGPEHYTNVPMGNVAIRNVANLYLYPNTVRAVVVTGAQVKDWLERSAGIFNQIAPGQADQTLINDGTVMDVAASRIVDLAWNGTPIYPAQRFMVATNKYRAGGGGAFPGADGTTVIFEAPDTNQDGIVRYIVDQGTINSAGDANWGFAALPGTTVLFDTRPGGAKFLSDVKGVQVEAAGNAVDGFARFRITL